MAGWLDYLNAFIPQGVTQPKPFAPGSMEYFREMYSPPPMMGSPFAPPDNPAWLKGAPTAVPMATQPEANLPPGQLPWLSNLQQHMTGGTPTDGPGMTLRINKPNVVPASNPPPSSATTSAPPMFGSPDTLGAINSVPYGSPASPTTPASKGTDWGSEHPLWSTLSAFGQGVSQPSWYGFGGQVMQGLGAASAANDPLKRAQTELLRAQAGKAKGDLANVELGRQIAASLPGNHPAKFPLMLGDLKGGAEKIGVDPNKMVNWNTETGKMEPNLLYIQAKVAESAAQGAMKWGEIGKDPSNNPVYGFPPVPDVRSILGATGLGPQSAAPSVPGQRAEVPVNPVAPGSAMGPGRGAPLAPGTVAQTTGEKQADEVFAKEKVDWQTTGRSDVAKNAAQLRQAIDRLKSGEAKTGFMFGITPRGMDAATSPVTTDTMEKVQEAAQRNLRAVLGGQFAEREGAQLISRVFNPYMKPEYNAERAQRLLTAIEQAAAAKDKMVAHFEKYGTLRGYTGPTMEDLRQQVRDAVPTAPAKATEAAPTQARIPTGKKLNGKPVYFNSSTGKYETD